MKVVAFMKEERSKLLATLIVASYFFYFWVNGPLDRVQEILSLEQIETEFSKPQLVGERLAHQQFNTVEDMETHGFGHGLMIKHKENHEYSGLIVSEEEHLNTEEHQKQVHRHANQLLDVPADFMVNGQSEIVYARDKITHLTYLESIGLVDNIRGYAGPVQVGVFIHSNGKIHSVHHIASKETESYLRKIKRAGFYDQFNGMILQGDHEVDAISGATLTSQAIASTTSELIAHANPEPLINLTEIDEMDPFSAEAQLSFWWILHLAVIGLMFLYGFQKKLKKTKKGVLILSILSVLYIGFFLNNSFTYVSFIHPFLGTAVSELVALYALLALLGAVWGKNTYCKYVCPFGNAQRLLLKVAPKKATAKFPLSNRWINRIRMGVSVVLIAGILLGFRSWSNFELFPDLFGLEIASLWFLGAIGTVGISIRYPMIWCRLLCPTGSVLDIISDFSNNKYKIPKWTLAK